MSTQGPRDEIRARQHDVDDLARRYGGAESLADAFSVIDTSRAATSQEAFERLVADDEALWAAVLDRRHQLVHERPPVERARRHRGRKLPRGLRPLGHVPAIVAHSEAHGETVRCGLYLHRTGQLAGDPFPPESLRDRYPVIVERALHTRTSRRESIFNGYRWKTRPGLLGVLLVRDVAPDNAVDAIAELRVEADELQALVLAEWLDQGALALSPTWLLAAGAVDRTPTLIADAEADAHAAAQVDARAEAARVAAEIQPAGGRGRRWRDRRGPRAEDVNARQIVPPSNDPLESP